MLPHVVCSVADGRSWTFAGSCLFSRKPAAFLHPMGCCEGNEPQGTPLPLAAYHGRELSCLRRSFAFIFQHKKCLRKVPISLQWRNRGETLLKIKLSCLRNSFAAWGLGFCSVEILWCLIRVKSTLESLKNNFALRHPNSCFQ